MKKILSKPKIQNTSYVSQREYIYVYVYLLLNVQVITMSAVFFSMV